MRYTPSLYLYKPPVYKLFQPQQDLSLCSCRSPPLAPTYISANNHY